MIDSDLTIYDRAEMAIIGSMGFYCSIPIERYKNHKNRIMLTHSNVRLIPLITLGKLFCQVHFLSNYVYSTRFDIS